MGAEKRPRFNLYQSVTDSVITAIEAGAGPFEMPWHRGRAAHALPTNARTGRRYRGVNVVALWSASAARGYGTHLWGTYRQWRALGAQVRQGEKASPIVFYKTVGTEKRDEETGEPRTVTRRVARASWVFNANQVAGFEASEMPKADPVERVERAEALVRETGAVVRHGGGEAFYDVIEDFIQMPEPASFTGTATSSPTEGYYATLLHELVHYSGADHRLARDLSGRFSSNAYAMEEMVAELGAAFLCAELGVTPMPRIDHAAYVAHWLAVLRADNRAIFAAASAAAAAAEYLLGEHRNQVAPGDRAAPIAQSTGE